MDDLSDELEEVKREIVESRSLTIKTNNLINGLAADVKSIARRQQDYERRLKWNSATAYAVAVVLLLIMSKGLVDARVETIRADTKDADAKLTRATKELAALRASVEARARTQRYASEFHALIMANQREAMLERFPVVSKLDLTKTERAIFEQAVERARSDLSMIAYQTGLDHIRTGRWQEAEQALRESLEYESSAMHSASAKYQLAHALCQLGRQRDAIPMLLQVSEASVDKEVMDDATFLLAEAQIEIGAWNDAKTTLRSFIRRFPHSAKINDARMKLAEVQLQH